MNHTRTERYLGTQGKVQDRYELANGMTLEHTFYLDYWYAKSNGDTTKQGAVYVSGAKEPETFEPALKYSVRGEDPEMDALWDLHNKFVVAYQREEIEKVKASPDYLELPEQVRTALESKMKFTRYAGCSCPCSPGWTPAKRDMLGYGGRVYIDNLAHEEEVQRKVAEAEAERERKAAERGFASVKEMQKADAEERWAAVMSGEMDAEVESHRLELAARYSEDL